VISATARTADVDSSGGPGGAGEPAHAAPVGKARLGWAALGTYRGMVQGRVSGEAVSEVRRVVSGEGGGEPALLPGLLARACAQVLGAAGAGLSLVDQEYRLPLGSSDGTAQAAERLQFTQGEGPCLEAAASGRTQVARMADMSARWPAFAEALAQQTPYAAIISLPLRVAPDYMGAIDLYLGGDAQLEAISLADAHDVVEEIARMLGPGLSGRDAPPGPHGPAWLGSPSARARGNVWIAIGMLMTPLDRPAPDVLALLRAYAYACGATLDDIAEGLASGALDPAQITL
jgi:hypothetical protein